MTVMSVEAQIGEIKGQLGELKGQVDGLGKRMDDMHRLLMILITVAGGGLLAAVVGLILQLVE